MNKCGAKNRAGNPCGKYGLKNGRCMFHGGKSTGKPGNKNAKKENGVYSKFLSDEDKQLEKQSDDLLGKLDSELSIARIQLARALKAQTLDPDSLKDFPKTIDLFLGRINSLEKTRKELLHDDSQDNVLTIIGGLPD
jgi:hypothetical protein